MIFDRTDVLVARSAEKPQVAVSAARGCGQDLSADRPQSPIDRDLRVWEGVPITPADAPATDAQKSTAVRMPKALDRKPSLSRDL
jgi:hypothetical protein